MSRLERKLKMEPTPLLVKLASIIVHYEEAMSEDGSPFDRQAAEAQLQDPEVQECFKMLSKNAMLPLKRS